MIWMSSEELQTVKNILKGYPYTFYAFGSRTKQSQAKQFSDLDLCYKESIPDHIISEIKEAFENSDLPFMVDFVSWERCSESFKQLIEKDLVKL